MTNLKVLSEIIDLPSEGIFYPKENPLSAGTIELKYMTARHEDILTTRSLIQRGLVLNRLLSELIVTPKVKVEDLLIGDRTALMIATRIMGYGKDYPIKVFCTECESENKVSVNLETLQLKKTTLKNHPKNTVEVTFKLPVSQATLVFKLPTVGSSLMVEQELDKIEEVTKSDVRGEITARMRSVILSVDGNSDRGFITTFVNDMPVRDSMAFREFLKEITPDVDMTTSMTCASCGVVQTAEVAIGSNFFWPHSRV